MSEREEILNSFMAMADTQDYGIAMDYLEKNDWDLTTAVDQYINTHNYRDNNPPGSSHQNQPTTQVPEEARPYYDYSGLEDDSPSNYTPPPGLGRSNAGRQNEQQNQPESLLGGAMNAFQNMASSISSNLMNSFPHPMGVNYGGIGGNNQQYQDSDMTIDNSKSSGRIFLEKFRDKNGAGIELPPFVDGSFEEIIKEAKRLRRPIFLYVHNHKGDS